MATCVVTRLDGEYRIQDYVGACADEKLAGSSTRRFITYIHRPAGRHSYLRPPLHHPLAPFSFHHYSQTVVDLHGLGRCRRRLGQPFTDILIHDPLSPHLYRRLDSHYPPLNPPNETKQHQNAILGRRAPGSIFIAMLMLWLVDKAGSW
jgi:hypothetical protein